MKVLLSWLREFTPIPDSMDPSELGLVMGDLGMAVEEMDVLGEGLDGIVVARVLDLRVHPDADRVQLVDVDAGDGQPLQIACGAFNMAVGDLVPLATIGTTMPNGMEIGRRKLRGEWSNGMLCSPSELNLPGEPSGILVLPESLTPGVPLTEALGIEADVLYDLEINPNRPDAMSVAGVARDLAARLGLPFTLPSPTVPSGPHKAADLVSVEIDDPERCGRFTARVLEGVTVRPSDPKIANRLTLLGMRPINNIVDVSNYVMLELGRPSHPYDLATLAGRSFRVRRAAEGETLTTLDDVERTLSDADLLICDGDDSPIGLAGIMGGADTEISETTTDVVVEMAWFERMPVARTARRLGLRSEASARFERGCDFEDMALAHDRFIELLGDAAGTVADGMVDVTGALPDRSPIAVRPERVNAMLGADLTPDEMKALLDPIGFTTEVEGDSLRVSLPSYRLDSDTEIDVVEEVGRMYGYSRLGKTMPVSTLSGGLTARQKERRALRAILTGLGCSEATPMPFLAPGDLERAGLPGDGISITNPLVAEESVLRTSLLPGLLKAVRHNVSHRNEGIALFEIGHVFRRPADPDAELPDEREVFAAIVVGADANDAVAIWRTVCDGLAVPGYDVANAEMPAMHPTRSGVARVEGEVVGSIGEVDPDVLAAYDISFRAAWIEIDVERFLSHPHGAPVYEPVSRFPSSDIDLAFEVVEGASATAIADTIGASAGELLGYVRLFDVYRGDGVADGARSLTYRIRLQATDRTLTDSEVGEVRTAIIEAVQSAHPAELRG
ncbi:phenylalanine--tRNA ligase subunit beta [Actinospongicola halichondriae]|uniref:phenylalanine--tRNA ligase subunit beta n=1 Tax=Actinospongicola halichondriae TaxID=3236844 RepID=UPI003D41A86C